MELPIAEIKTDIKLSRKIELSIIIVSVIIVITLLLTVPLIYAIAASIVYSMVIVYGFYVLRSLNLYVGIYRDRILIVQGTRRYNVRYEDIKSIIIEPRVVSISIQPSLLPERLSSVTSAVTSKVKLPSIVAGTYIVRIRLKDETEDIVLQIFKDEYEVLIKALDKVRKLGTRLPEIIAY